MTNKGSIGLQHGILRPMNLLIDGHNLIGQMPGIALSDPDDEAKLVLVLRRYSVQKRNRQVVVVFDNGVYGHPQSLDGYGITCHFARSPQDADTQLIRRINNLARPREWALVSSDRAVTSAANARGVRVIAAHTFAHQLMASTQKPQRAPEEKRDVRLSEAEIRAWMREFGEEE
jgi:uncharacterized protein